MKGAVYTHPIQTELALPHRATDEILKERLARAVAEYESATTSGQRLEIGEEIARLQRMLAPARKVGPQGV